MHCPSRWTFESSIRYCPNYYVIISIINERPHFFHTFAKKIFGLLHCIWKTLCIWNCERGVSPPGPINVTGFITALFWLLHCKAMPYLFYFLVVRKGIVSLYIEHFLARSENVLNYTPFSFHPAALLSICTAKMLRTHKFNGSVAGLQELINNFKRGPNVWVFNCIKRHNQVLLPYLYSPSLSLSLL